MTKQSLIKTENQQLDLIDPAAIMELELVKEEQAGHFTGERLFKQHPDKYAMVVDLLAEGIGLRRIGRLLKVSPNTVRAVRDREPDLIDTVKERLSRSMKHGVEMCAEAILDDLDDDKLRDKISTRDKSIILGVLSEKYLLLAGQATQIIDIQGVEPDHDAFNKHIAGLATADAQITGKTSAGEKQKTLDAEFVEVDAVPGADPVPPADGADGLDNGGIDE